jgi:hypothetical protein
MLRCRLSCPACGKAGQVPAKYRGCPVRCPRCGFSFKLRTTIVEDTAAKVLLKAGEPVPVSRENLDEMYL